MAARKHGSTCHSQAYHSSKKLAVSPAGHAQWGEDTGRARGSQKCQVPALTHRSFKGQKKSKRLPNGVAVGGASVPVLVGWENTSLLLVPELKQAPICR